MSLSFEKDKVREVILNSPYFVVQGSGGKSSAVQYTNIKDEILF